MKRLLLVTYALWFGFVFAGAAQAGLNDGLVAYYPFNGNANDESGNGNNGAVYGATLTQDKAGSLSSAYLFDGIDDYMELPHPGYLAEGTVAAWVYFQTVPNPFPANGWMWFCISENPINQNFEGVDFGVHPYYANNLAFGIYDKSIWDWRWADSGVQPVAGTWYHFVGTWGSGGINIYIDGELKGSNPYTGGIPQWTHYNYLGGNTWGGYVNSALDEVRIYNRALSEAEIRELYSMAPTPLVGTLEISPPSHDFGTVGIRDSASQEFTLRNTGAGSLTISEIKISDTPDFALIFGSGSNPCTTSPTIPPGGSCTFSVSFDPSSKGNSFASLTVSSNDPDSPSIEVALAGTTLSHGLGWLLTIDGMDPWASLLGPMAANPSTYLCDAIDEGWRTTIYKEVGPIVPFIWDRITVHTPTAVNNLYERIKYLNSTNRRVVVLAHSWGTVLTYIALQKHSDIHVAKLITLGSPLDSNFPGVSSFTRGWLEEANIYSVEKPSNLDVWHNYYIKCDPISARISALPNKDNQYTKKDYGGIFACHSAYYEESKNWRQILGDVVSR